jgi:hypothetical protein
MITQLYKDMRSKFGFCDGESVPEGAFDARKKVIEYINSVLLKDSEVEAYGFDRPGMHNWCLILYRKKGSTDNESLPEPEGITDGLSEAEVRGEVEVRREVKVWVT